MSDIKLFRPERVTDNPDGGGLATHTEIVDGEVNNLFDDISRIDRVNGICRCARPSPWPIRKIPSCSQACT
ncbi:hypothetical protein [Luteimonas cellulosilyticus]|uniref:hypothetical protein n=1 Tax=Luteimonas cellulosilyticus TaxID=2683586 RepID=UPI001358A512|nr:hypothetical protein [Luteimonas cellulosilyticus]